MQQAIRQTPYASQPLGALLPSEPIQPPYTPTKCFEVLSNLNFFVQLWRSGPSGNILRLADGDPNSALPSSIAEVAESQLRSWIQETRSISSERQAQEMAQKIWSYWSGSPPVVSEFPFSTLLADTRDKKGRPIMCRELLYSFSAFFSPLTTMTRPRDGHPHPHFLSRSSPCRYSQLGLPARVGADEGLCNFVGGISGVECAVEVAETFGEL